MKGQNNRKYAIYSRKSKFTGKGESIENQIELCVNISSSTMKMYRKKIF